MLQLWGIWNTSSLTSLPGLLWPGVVAYLATLISNPNCIMILKSRFWKQYSIKLYGHLPPIIQTIQERPSATLVLVKWGQTHNFFIYCGLFVLILVGTFLWVVSSSLCFGQISPLAFFRWFNRDWNLAETYWRRHNTQKKPTKMRTKKSSINKKINTQIKKPHLKMIPIKDKLIIDIH